MGTVGKGAVEVEEDDAVGHGIGRVTGRRAGRRFCRFCGKGGGHQAKCGRGRGGSGDQYVLLLAVTDEFDEFNEADVAVMADLYAGKGAGGVFMHDVPVKPVVAVAAGKNVVCFIVTQDAGVLLPVFLCFDFGFIRSCFCKRHGAGQGGWVRTAHP